MTTEEFKKWLERESIFTKARFGFWDYEVETDYANMEYDTLTINEDGTVTFTTKEKYWGGYDTVETNYTFEDFISFYKNIY